MKPGNFFRLISVMALPAIGFFSLGCTGNDPEPRAEAFTAECSTTLVVAGYWNVAFKCENGECVPGRDTYLVTQELSDLTTVSAEIMDSTLPGDIGVVFEGELCGNVFTFSATDPGNDENGTWTFSDTQHFTKATTFAGGTHTCTGNGAANSLPLPDPVICLGP